MVSVLFKTNVLCDELWTSSLLGISLLFFGSERVCTVTASEQPTGHSMCVLTPKAEEEGFKVSANLSMTRVAELSERQRGYVIFTQRQDRQVTSVF